MGLLACITWLFLLITPYLGHENFQFRELADDILYYCRPFSDYALTQELTNPNPEISKRSATLLCRGFKWTLDLKAYFICKELIYTDYEDFAGLPWLPNKVEDKYVLNLRINKALTYFIKEKGLNWYIYENSETHIYGINDFRFFVRGLEYPSSPIFEVEKEQEKWKEIKNTWRKK